MFDFVKAFAFDFDLGPPCRKCGVLLFIMVDREGRPPEWWCDACDRRTLAVKPPPWPN